MCPPEGENTFLISTHLGPLEAFTKKDVNFLFIILFYLHFLKPPPSTLFFASAATAYCENEPDIPFMVVGKLLISTSPVLLGYTTPKLGMKMMTLEALGLMYVTWWIVTHHCTVDIKWAGDR